MKELLERYAPSLITALVLAFFYVVFFEIAFGDSANHIVHIAGCPNSKGTVHIAESKNGTLRVIANIHVDHQKLGVETTDNIIVWSTCSQPLK